MVNLYDRGSERNMNSRVRQNVIYSNMKDKGEHLEDAEL